jgi:hypothetical protein
MINLKCHSGKAVVIALRRLKMGHVLTLEPHRGCKKLNREIISGEGSQAKDREIGHPLMWARLDIESRGRSRDRKTRKSGIECNSTAGG